MKFPSPYRLGVWQISASINVLLLPGPPRRWNLVPMQAMAAGGGGADADLTVRCGLPLRDVVGFQVAHQLPPRAPENSPRRLRARVVCLKAATSCKSLLKLVIGGLHVRTPRARASSALLQTPACPPHILRCSILLQGVKLASEIKRN